MESKYSVEVSPERANNSHSFVIQLVGKQKRVLELGAASGHVTQVLMSRGNQVTAVESDGTCFQDLTRIASEVIISDLDWLSLDRDLQGRSFDVIVLGDVLEHTKQPELILAQLRTLLAPEGYLVVTLPNVAHGDVRLALLEGRFPYSDRGLLDQSHLHFFTRTTVKKIFQKSGYQIDEIYGTTTPLGTTELGIELASVDPGVLEYVVNAPDSDVYQFVIKATVGPHTLSEQEQLRERNMSDTRLELLSEVSALNKIVSTLNNQLALKELEMENLLSQIESQADDFAKQIATQSEMFATQKQQLELERLEFRDWSIGVMSELGEARARSLDLEQVRHETVLRLEQEMTRAFNAERALSLARVELSAIRTSRTWRTGRIVLAPMRFARKLLKKIY